MNNNIKILMTVFTESGTLVRKSEAEIIKGVVTEKEAYHKHLWKSKDGSKVVQSFTLEHHSLVPKVCSQHINMSVDAYNFMTSTECLYGFKPKDWNTMSKKKRLEAHLQKVCEHFNGTSYTYEVLED